MDEAIIDYVVLLILAKNSTSEELAFTECTLWVSEYKYKELSLLRNTPVDHLSNTANRIKHRHFPIELSIDYLDIEIQELKSIVSASLFEDKIFIINSTLLYNIITDLLFGKEVIANSEMSEEIINDLKYREVYNELNLSRIDGSLCKCLTVPALGNKYAVVVDRHILNRLKG